MNILHDFRFALRQLRSNPGFAAAAVLSLGLGIGATTAIFSLGNGLLAKHVPGVAAPERLARVYRNEHSPLPWTDLRSLRNASETFSSLVGERPVGVGLGSEGGVERVDGALVTGDFFSILGVGAAAGRVFSYAPDREEAAPAVVVLAHDFWRARFGGDPGVVGRTLAIDGRPFTVVGVVERGFTSSQLMWRPSLFLPVGRVGDLLGTELDEWDGTLYVTGRLAPGVDLEEAGAELEVLWGRLRETDPRRDERMTVRVDDARGITAEARTPLALGIGLLLAMAGLVLLLACANVANLLLARAMERRREIAARLAIGASRVRLVRQLLTESLTLAAIGGLLGYGIAAWATRLLPRLLPERLPASFDPTPDGTVLLFSAGAALLTGLVFGLAPALQASSPELVPALKDEDAGYGFGRSRLRGALLVAQVTLCVVTLATAGLFVRSLAEAAEMDPGFDPVGILDVPIYLETARFDAEEGVRFYRALAERLRARPGIEAATLARFVPLAGANSGGSLIRRGIDEADPRAAPSTYKNEVGPGYFEMLDIRILRGRGFTERDGPGAPGVVILNETAAERLWPGEDPIGKRVAVDDPEGPFLEVVGIVEDTKFVGPAEGPGTFAYRPLLQRYRSEVFLHVRSSGPPGAAARAVEEVAAEVDPRVAVGAARSMEEDMSVSLVPARAGALLLGVFGALALVIAAVGLYGVTAYTASRRTREIGIRTAIGARPADVIRLVVGGTLRRVAVGVALGLALAAGVGRLASGLLYGVSPFDPALTLATPAILAVVALLATWLPARRAAKSDPTAALRHT